MGIDQYLKVIKEGVFGRDVRQAIHDGIEQVYEDATFDGNANMEVAKARGEHNNLSERLKNMVAQIQSLSDSAPKGVYKNIEALNTAFPKGRDGIYLTQNDGKWNFWDGSKWGPWRKLSKSSSA